MKPYTAMSNKARTMARDDIHHRTADCPRSVARAKAKAARKAARREARMKLKGE